MQTGSDVATIELMAMQSAWRDLTLRWELTWQERKALLPTGGEDLPQPPVDTERRMRILIEIGYRIRFDDDDELQDWLRMPSELLNWHSPIEAMSSPLPDLRRFRQFVEMGLGC